MSRRWVLLAVFPLISLLTMAQAAAPPAHGVLSLEGKQIPLPDGEWVEAGSASPSEGLVSVALLQLRGGTVVAGVLIQASRLGTAPDWGGAPGCERTDLPLARTHYRSDHDGSCAYVARTEAGGGGPVDAAWQEAQGRAVAQGWTLPDSWAVATVRVTAPLSGVQVRYAAALGPAGGPDAAALVTWTEAAWEQVERGLHNQLDPARPLPGWNSPGPPPPWALPPPDQGRVTLSRSVWKTISYRVIGTSIDFTTNLIAIGDLATAAALSSLPILIGPWIYLGHELAWEHFGAPAERHEALPGLGAETPWPQQPAGKTS
jgi:uncharacterized membrane protein